NNCPPSDHQPSGSGLPPGHPHHPTPPQYVVGQPPPQQQTPPASSAGACLPPEYNTRPSPHFVFGGGGGPGSTPENAMFGAGPGDSGLLNGGSGGLPPRSSGMMPPPPPEYSSGMPSSVSGGYPPSGPDLKASPLHTGPSLGPDLMGPSGGPPPLIPSEYPPCTGPGSNGNGPGTSGFGNAPDSVMMMPPPSHQQGGVLPPQQQHLASVGGSQGQAPPPPQYVPSSGQHSGSGGATLQSVCGGSNPSPAGGPGSVQFPLINKDVVFNELRAGLTATEVERWISCVVFVYFLALDCVATGVYCSSVHRLVCAFIPPDRRVRGSKPTSASQLPLPRLGRLGSIPPLVLPLAGTAAGEVPNHVVPFMDTEWALFCAFHSFVYKVCSRGLVTRRLHSDDENKSVQHQEEHWFFKWNHCGYYLMVWVMSFEIVQL
ncbi:hypothetical protein CLF_109042, partial [Clonorchis sinensis]